jgi:hypothetical protein
MRLASRTDRHLRRVAGVAVVSGLALVGSFAAACAAAAADSSPSVAIVLNGHGAAFAGTVEITCESPAVPAADGVDIGTAARATRQPFSVPADGTTTLTIADLTAGSACSVTASGPTAALLGAVDGGTPLVGADGQLRGVAVTVDRGTTATAHLTYDIPFAIASSVPHGANTTTATGSGSAASTPPPLPGGDGAASAAAPVALAAARSTTTASSAALPDTSGSSTTLVLASIGVLLCGAAAYVLVVRDRKEPHTHD